MACSVAKVHLLAVFGLLSFCLSAYALGIGSPRNEVVTELGEPIGRMDVGEGEILFYEGGTVEMADGAVRSIDSNLVVRTVRARARQAFVAKQEARGLVEYRGVWVTPEKMEDMMVLDLMREDIYTLETQGRETAITDFVLPGKITVVLFYIESDTTSLQMGAHLEDFVRSYPDVVFRKIEILKLRSDIADQYSVRSVPDMRVYDRQGRIVGRPTGMLYKVIARVESVM